jgi:hypothetical protein
VARLYLEFMSDEFKEDLKKNGHHPEGTICYNCGRWAHVDSRSISGVMASRFLWWWNEYGRQWGLTTNSSFRADRLSNAFTEMKHWGFIRKMALTREEKLELGWKHPSSATWRITKKGKRFAIGELAVPKYALVYANTLFGHAGPLVTISDCFDKEFNFSEVMGNIQDETNDFWKWEV